MRKPEIVVLSDVHLGIYGCQSKSLLSYLQTIQPETLILNGDIIDIWNFSRYNFNNEHIKVLRVILKMIEKGTELYYITGNHDEAIRKFSGFELKNFHISDHLILDLDGRKTWIFHGDIFDATTAGWTKWLAKLGGKGYDILIFLNKLINDILYFFGREKISMSKKIKNSFKTAVKWISNFEATAIDLAHNQKFDVVICGHIHQPIMKTSERDGHKILYLNSGDWVENCTALEFEKRRWSLVRYSNEQSIEVIDSEKHTEDKPNKSQLRTSFYKRMVDTEFDLIHTLFTPHKEY
jgi:UDP-2,3-diacylglucosamine pyrophosphatase LpxH